MFTDRFKVSVTRDDDYVVQIHQYSNTPRIPDRAMSLIYEGIQDMLDSPEMTLHYNTFHHPDYELVILFERIGDAFLVRISRMIADGSVYRDEQPAKSEDWRGFPDSRDDSLGCDERDCEWGCEDREDREEYCKRGYSLQDLERAGCEYCPHFFTCRFGE